MFCTKCGKEIPEGDKKICDECEKKLLEEIENEEEEQTLLENSKEEKKDNKKNKDKKEENKSNKKSKDEEKIENKEEKTEKKPCKKITKIIIAVIICIIALLLILSIIYYLYNYNRKGNTIGNIRNYGYATIDGEWIYYLAPSEDNSKLGIFKIRNNGEDKKEIIMRDDIDIISLNVYGNYIYFIGTNTAGFNENNELDNKIYRMKLDGSDLEIINDNELNDTSYEIFVVNNHVYYTGVNGEIAKMDLDGSNKTTVLDNQLGYLAVSPEYIIYDSFDEKDFEDDSNTVTDANIVTNGEQDTNTIENTVENPAENTVENSAENTIENDAVESDSEEVSDKGYVTYIMNLDGTNKRPIIKDKKLYCVNIEGDYIYYTDKDGKIYRTKIDSNVEELLYDIKSYNFNTNGEYGYYLYEKNVEDEDTELCIYRSKLDGSSTEPELVKEMERGSQFIDVVGDWIYYMDSDDESGFINLVKIDGSDETVQLYYLNYEEYYNYLLTQEEENAEQSQDETNSTAENIDQNQVNETVENTAN